MPVYSVIVPCYNEEPVLRETHKRLTAVLSAMDGDYEIVYVNDGSRDHTPDILNDLAAHDPCVRAVHFARNAGHQMAVTAGLDYATGDAIVIIDADLQDPPEIIPEMAAKWRAGAQVVYGQRNRRAGESAFKKFTAFAYYRLLRAMTSTDIPADTGDFRLVDRQVADVVRRMPEHARFLRGMFAWVGFRQEAVRYDRDKRFAGETHYPLKKMLALAFDGITSLSVKPIRIIVTLGMLVSMVSFIGVIWAVVQALLGNSVAGWASTICIVCFMGGIQLISLGVIGEYIGKIYMESKHRPRYIISDRTWQPYQRSYRG